MAITHEEPRQARIFGMRKQAPKAREIQGALVKGEKISAINQGEQIEMVVSVHY